MIWTLIILNQIISNRFSIKLENDMVSISIFKFQFKLSKWQLIVLNVFNWVVISIQLFPPQFEVLALYLNYERCISDSLSPMLSISSLVQLDTSLESFNSSYKNIVEIFIYWNDSINSSKLLIHKFHRMKIYGRGMLVVRRVWSIKIWRPQVQPPILIRF